MTALLLALLLAPAPVATTLPARPEGAAAITPTAAFATDGTLWVAWVEGRHVYAASSRDHGRTFRGVSRVNPEPEPIDANGEARPKIAVGPKGAVYVSYTRRLDQPYTGEIRFSRRLPSGGFSAPVTVNDDRLVTGHRFDLLTVSPTGDVHLFWIDKRDLEAAVAKKQGYDGAALYTAVSKDGGRTFSPNRKVKDHICECCRLAVAWDGGKPVLFWRDLRPGDIRDHSLARLDGAETVLRATDDDWKIAGCPHHGPSIAISDGTLHLAWFTGEGPRGAGAFYRRSMDGGRSFSAPVQLGGRTAARATLAATGKDVWVAWKEPVGSAYAIRMMTSQDAGTSWSAPVELARTAGESDHPLLITDRGTPYLSWFTKADGYRLLPVAR